MTLTTLAESPLLRTARLGRTDYWNGIVPMPRMDIPVDPAVVAELCRIPNFRRAYEPAGLAPRDFDHYPPAVRTLRTYTAAAADLAARVRDILLPDPDLTT